MSRHAAQLSSSSRDLRAVIVELVEPIGHHAIGAHAQGIELDAVQLFGSKSERWL